MFEIIFDFILHMIPEYIGEKASRYFSNKKVCRVVAEVVTLLLCLLIIVIFGLIIIFIYSLFQR